MGRLNERTARAVAAAVAVAGRHGLTVDEPRMLHDGVNAVVHLAPAPVVARVATLTPLLRADPGRPFAREVAVADALARAGAAVVPPTDLLPPGPYEHDGLTLAFWSHVVVLPDRPTPGQSGAALAELHDALASLDTALLPAGRPLDTPLEDLTAFGRHGPGLGADPELAARAATLAAELVPRLGGPPRLLHGDAHPGNLLATPSGWRWADLEDTCTGPREWDLACLRSTSRLDGRAALDALPEPVADEQLAPFLALRALHAAAWWFVHAVRVPADLPEARRRLRSTVERLSREQPAPPDRG